MNKRENKMKGNILRVNSLKFGTKTFVNAQNNKNNANDSANHGRYSFFNIQALRTLFNEHINC